jgi:hypothetical protein
MSQAINATPRVPAFETRAEEAEFWDTHDVTDYWDESQPITLDVARPLSERVTIDIDAETMDEVRTAAAERGMPVDVLLQIWILERRDAERARRAAPEPNGTSTEPSE